MYKVKNLLFFIFYLALNPRYILLVLQKIYIPIFIQFEWLKKYNIKTIIDVGAHQGKVTKALNYIFPKADIYGFEPCLSNYKLASSEVVGKNIKIENVALSDQVGTNTFFEYSNDVLSSLMQKKINYYGQSILLDKYPVKTITLDSYFKNLKLKSHVLLKIDTQGNEGLVLKGGKKMLRQVSIIHIEMSFKEFYKGQDLFPEIYTYLVGLGFVYAGEARESHFYPFFAPESQINAIFFNKAHISNF